MLHRFVQRRVAKPASESTDIVVGDGPPCLAVELAVCLARCAWNCRRGAWAMVDKCARAIGRIVANGERAYGISTGLRQAAMSWLEGEAVAELSRNTCPPPYALVGMARLR